MANFPGTDRHILTQKAYATDEAYATRKRTHETYSIPKIDFPEWVLDRVTWRGDEVVLDIGSGPGSYFDVLATRIPDGRLIAGDLSFGMVQKAAHHPKADMMLNGDAQTLPFSSGVFDIVLANHMLFHVPDIDKALSEIHRVLKPSGTVIAATNSQFNQPEFEQLFRRTYGLLGAIGPEIEPMKPVTHNFYLEDAPRKLARHFFAVARYDFPSAFIFPSTQPVIDYINSTRAIREPQLPRQVSWDDFISVLGDQVQRLINHFGELVVNKLAGVVVGTDVGGFAQEYISALKK